jgi:hypothetical protein
MSKKDGDHILFFWRPRGSEMNKMLQFNLTWEFQNCFFDKNAVREKHDTRSCHAVCRSQPYPNALSLYGQYHLMNAPHRLFQVVHCYSCFQPA